VSDGSQINSTEPVGVYIRFGVSVMVRIRTRAIVRIRVMGLRV